MRHTRAGSAGTPRAPGDPLAAAAPGIFLAAAALGACLAGAPACAWGAARPPVAVKLLAINDYHGHLRSPGSFGANTAVPAAHRPPVGGADALAAHVARLRARNPRNTVVVGAGDLVGASPLVSSLVHDEPAVETLNRIGLEFNAAGNHEFDRGAAELLRLQNGGCRRSDGSADPGGCRGASVGTPVPFEGARFRWLSANVYDRATGRTLLPAYGTRVFDGVPVAFVGLTLKTTPTIVVPSGVAGLEFRDEADTVNALVPELRARGIEAIVALLHEGGAQTGALQDIDGCEGGLAGSPLADIVARLDDAVDLVISGHTHAAYNCLLPNAAGRRIPVTSASAFGRVLTDVDLAIDPATRDVVAVRATNRLVDRSDPAVVADPVVAGIVAKYEALAAPLARRVIGRIAAELPNTARDAACNMPAGELIADAHLAATASAAAGGARIAFTNRGGVRTPGFTMAPRDGERPGEVTYGEAFTVQPFGNSLVTMSLSAQALKDVLEQQFAGCRGQAADTTRILVPSRGFAYTWDGARACGERVRGATLAVDGVTETIVDAAGAVPRPDRTYRVTVNSYLAAGGDGFAGFVDGTQRVGGAQDLDALAAYLARFMPPAEPYRPGADPADFGGPRIRRIGGSACPTGANPDP